MLTLSKNANHSDGTFAFGSSDVPFNIRPALPVLILSVLAAVVFLTSLCFAQPASDQPVLQLRTNLGVDVTIPLKKDLFDFDIHFGDFNKDSLMEYLLGVDKFYVYITDGVYMIVPWEIFRQAELKDGIHIITLTNDQQLKGELVGIVRLPNSRKYQLHAAAKVVLSNYPKKEPTLQERGEKAEKPWQLHVSGPIDLTYSVSNPRFVYRHFSSAGYIIGGRFYFRESLSFYVNIEGDEILANLPDFEKISFTKLTQKENSVSIHLRSKSGVETNGMPILKEEDQEGWHEALTWFLVMDLADTDGALIVLIEPNCSLTRAL